MYTIPHQYEGILYMIPYLFHIGPLYFNMYGFWIAVGLLAFVYFAQNDRLAKKFLKPGQLVDIALFCLVIGVIGGRALDIIQEYPKYTSLYEILAFWEPGYSLLGTVIAIIVALPLYLHYHHINIIATFDLMGIYAPLLQAIARIGCFFAGCCHGYDTCMPWAVTYTHPDSLALLNIALHPTQLYSAISLLSLFIMLRFIIRPYVQKPGQLLSLYLIGSSVERFFNDFFRAEHYDGLLVGNMFSSSQCIALFLIVLGIAGLCLASFTNNKSYALT
jgi:phosphatidylglycerol---prolipoprotein diacylglyceryl transferase